MDEPYVVVEERGNDRRDGKLSDPRFETMAQPKAAIGTHLMVHVRCEKSRACCPLQSTR